MARRRTPIPFGTQVIDINPPSHSGTDMSPVPLQPRYVDPQEHIEAAIIDSVAANGHNANNGNNLPAVGEAYPNSRFRASPAPAVDCSRMTDGFGNTYSFYRKRGEQFDFEELPYVLTSIGLYKFCYQHRVRGEARNVLDWLVAHIETDNIVMEAVQHLIAAETGIYQSNICNAMNKLEKMGLILRGKGAGQVWLNPRLIFIGQPQDQKRCVKKWDERRARWEAARQVKSDKLSRRKAVGGLAPAEASHE